MTDILVRPQTVERSVVSVGDDGRAVTRKITEPTGWFEGKSSDGFQSLARTRAGAAEMIERMRAGREAAGNES